MNKKDMCTTKRIQRETNFTLPRYVYWKGGSGSKQWGHGEGAALWDLGRELTIGHTRGEVLSLIVSASAEISGALSRRLRRLALQHVYNVHTVDTLQSCVQALHCSEDVWMRDTSRQRQREGGEGFQGQTAIPLQHQSDFGWVEEAETSVLQIKAQRNERNSLWSHILTLGPLALAGGPQVEQCRALLQQRVGILHTDLIDVIHAELKLACQLCVENESETIKLRKYLYNFTYESCRYSVHSLVLEMVLSTATLSTRGRIICQTAMTIGRKTENN